MSRIAVITGATSGIGAAAARRFVAGGWQVVGSGRREARLAALEAELGSAFRGVCGDVRDDACRTALVEAAGAADLLINNAGLALGTAPATAADPGQWRQMIDTNVTALALTTHALLPRLIERRGAIINLGSVAGSYPYPGGNVYGGTKAFVHQFTLGLRSDLHGTGVRVTAIEPGMVETEFTMVRTGGNQGAHDALYAGCQPMTAEDIAETLWWVATLPPHLNINTIELMPVSQSFGPFQVARAAS